MGVGGLGQGVAQAVVEGVVDQRQEPLDGLGEGDELRDAAASGPGQPAGQQRPPAGALGLEGGAELLLEEVRPIQRVVDLRDARQGGLLVPGQIRGVLQQRPPAALDRGRGRGVTGGAELVPHPAAHRVQRGGGPGHDVERVIPTSYLV